jgi:hypothetical protein
MAGCAAVQGTVSGAENCLGPPMGLYAYPGRTSSPLFDAQYKIVAQRNIQAGMSPANGASFVITCEANLRARGLLYARQNAGDCGAPVGAPTGFGSGQIVGLSGAAASGVIGGLGAVGALSGAATFGIGTAVTLAVSAISGIFTHHAAAVANEQATICSVVNYFNPIVKQIDDAVASGQISDQEGIVYMTQVANQAINGLQGIYQKCNAACFFIGFLKAHIDWAGFYYPRLSPNSALTPNRPGQAPSTINPPGSSIDAGAIPPARSTSDPTFIYKPSIPVTPPITPPQALPYTPPTPAVTPTPSVTILPSGTTMPSDYLNIGYNQPSGQAAQAAPVAPTSTDWPMIAAVVIIALLLLAVL